MHQQTFACWKGSLSDIHFAIYSPLLDEKRSRGSSGAPPIEHTNIENELVASDSWLKQVNLQITFIIISGEIGFRGTSSISSLFYSFFQCFYLLINEYIVLCVRGWVYVFEHPGKKGLTRVLFLMIKENIVDLCLTAHTLHIWYLSPLFTLGSIGFKLGLILAWSRFFYLVFWCLSSKGAFVGVVFGKMEHRTSSWPKQ